MRVDNDGIGLHVEQAGDGPPLVLLHGITNSTATYRWLIPRLTDRCTTYAVDFRGHGRSDRAPDAYLLSDFVTDAVAVLRAIGEPVLLLGHSLGGGVAACAAQQHPDLVRAVFLEDPAMFGRQAAESDEQHVLLTAFGLLRAGIPTWQESGATVEQLKTAFAQAPSSAGGTLGELLTDDGLEAMVEALLQLDPTVLDPVLDQTSQPQYVADEPMGVPGTILAPDPDAPDGLLRTEHVLDLEKRNPDLRVEVLAGAGHLIHDAKAHRARYVELLDDVLAAYG